MAINQALIRPDAVGAFTDTFRTVDSSMRDRQRLALTERQMQESAIQRARENKANDFKMMMMALERGDTLQQRAISNDLQRQQLQTGQFNAATSRYNAFHPASANNPANLYQDPVGGLFGAPGAGGYTKPGTGYQGGAAAPAGTGVGPTATPVYGDPPNWGVNADVTNPNDPALTDLVRGNEASSAALEARQSQERRAAEMNTDLPAASTGTNTDASIVLPPEPPPVPDFTPGAPGAPGAPGPPADPGAAAAPPIPEAAATPPAAPETPVLNPGDTFPPPPPSVQNGPAIPPTPVQAAGVQPVPAPVAPAVPATPRFADAGLGKSTRADLDKLRREEAMLRGQAGEATDTGSIIANQIPRLSPQNQAAGLQKLGELRRTVTEKSIEADRIKERSQEEAKKLEILKARSSALADLEGIENYLPEADRRRLIAKAGDPASKTGEEMLQTMTDYASLRRRYGLTHDSNGIDTAAAVVRARQLMDSQKGQELEFKATRAKGLESKMKALKDEIAASGGSDKIKQTEFESLAKEAVKYEGDIEAWNNLKGVYNMALDKDTDTSKTGAGKKAAQTGVEGAAGISKLFLDAVGGGNAPSTSGPLPSAIAPSQHQYMTPEKQAEANTFWNEGKNRVHEIGQLDRIPYQDLQAIIGDKARPDMPIPKGGRLAEFTPEEKAQLGLDKWGNMPSYTEQKTREIMSSGRFKMPEGAGDRRVRGRSGEVTVKDFLIEAAKAEKARRDALGQRGAQPGATNEPLTDKNAATLETILSTLKNQKKP